LWSEIMDTRYFQHYKGGKYELLTIGTNSESLQKEVVYRALYGDHRVWVRPFDMFFGQVVVDGVSRPRFAEITEREAMA